MPVGLAHSQGEEWVQVSGIIRLADIDQDNRISSIRVADARISYSGKGAVHVFSAQDDDETEVHGAQIHARMR